MRYAGELQKIILAFLIMNQKKTVQFAFSLDGAQQQQKCLQ